MFFEKRGSLLGNEEHHLGGNSPIFEIEYSDLEQRSIFSILWPLTFYSDPALAYCGKFLGALGSGIGSCSVF